MANITIPDLRPAGSELFIDFESFMNELTDQELSAVNGGVLPVIAIWGIPVATKYVVGAMAGGAIVGGVAATRQ